MAIPVSDCWIDPGDQHEPRPDIERFMMRPGTNICFNPYKHEAGSGGENTYLSDKTIGSVRVLWQSKDAGTSGDLVMGYAVSNEAGSYNHQNLVTIRYRRQAKPLST